MVEKLKLSKRSSKVLFIFLGVGLIFRVIELIRGKSLEEFDITGMIIRIVVLLLTLYFLDYIFDMKNKEKQQ